VEPEKASNHYYQDHHADDVKDVHCLFRNLGRHESYARAIQFRAIWRGHVLRLGELDFMLSIQIGSDCSASEQNRSLFDIARSGNGHI
jgi:hypothetical protein